MKLLEVSSKFINYVNSQDKVSLKNLNDDWNLSETFKKNVKSYLNKIKAIKTACPIKPTPMVIIVILLHLQVALSHSKVIGCGRTVM
jgi:hypothetical protein